MKKIRLGINIDHVATLRNARGGVYPDPIEVALLLKKYGADSVTAHLREDRRHIRDKDIYRLVLELDLPLNLEMAATDEMLKIALDVKPKYVCLVPEKRIELTTEGGLNVYKEQEKLKKYVAKLKDAGIKVSIFIEPELKQIDASKYIDADAVELHTGTYSNAEGKQIHKELIRLQEAAKIVKSYKLSCHAGHGLDYSNVTAIAKISEIEELNIGHYLIGSAVFIGIGPAVYKMREIIDQARI